MQLDVVDLRYFKLYILLDQIIKFEKSEDAKPEFCINIYKLFQKPELNDIKLWTITFFVAVSTNIVIKL